MNKKVEILAPAGNFACLVAAIKSGADAVYVGGGKFGARANANNFTEDELYEAIDLAHLHNRQLYLTVNTLLKEDELEKELYDYIYPLYIHGLDAVIVQDLGVLQFIKKNFPELPIHASTQMTVTSYLGAKFLEEQGVERIVTSRELSINEVNEISKKSNLEIESFVHGALCYSFSGQCLYSSMIGGRSGNRGQCAQPCRLPYKVENKTDYFMSLKDICTLKEIPELVEAGVFSFKIEGRMKKPEYVASVTSMYRKYVDLYLTNGKKGYCVSEDDMDLLRDIFNRGDFHGGYWKQHNGREMITKGRPNHTGVPVVQVLNQNGRMVIGKVLKTINKGDILEISDKGDNYTLGKPYNIGDKIELSLRKGVVLEKNKILYRTRNQWLIDTTLAKIDDVKLQEPVTATLVVMVGAPLALHLQYKGLYVSVEGEVVMEAEKAPTTREKILQQLGKTGNTPFKMESIEVVMDENVFLPIQQLNQLRRESLDKLYTQMVESHRRANPILHTSIKEERLENEKGRNITAYVESLEQFNVVLAEEFIDAIYVDCNAIPCVWNDPMLKLLVEKAHNCNKRIYLVMPHIFRKNTLDVYQESFEKIVQADLDGIMVRNLEEFQFLKEEGYSKEILTDHHVYIYNNNAIEFWKKNNVTTMTHSLELTAKELNLLEQKDMELVIYGYTPNMISAQCIKKTSGKCDKISSILKIKDRINKEIHVKSCCDYCYNIVYNHCPTCLFDEYQEIEKLAPKSLRLAFTVESEKETIAVLESAKQFIEHHFNDLTKIETTKGHFRRGIQ